MSGKATRQQIVEEALKWQHVPWKHQGRSRTGIDCIGLIVLVGKSLGLMTYDVHGYTRQNSPKEFLFHFQKALKQKSVLKRKKGDVVLLRDTIYAGHSAIISEMYGKESIIHSYLGRRKVVHEPLTPDVEKKISYCFEFPNIVEEI